MRAVWAWKEERFLSQLAAQASSLLAINQVNAAAGKSGGFFTVAGDAALDAETATDALGGDEFIFDVQGHYVNPTGAWLQSYPDSARPFSSMTSNPCVAAANKGAGREYLNCLGAEEFIKDVFMDSDTDMIVLSFMPSARDSETLTIEEADATRRIVDAMKGDHRLLLHGRVNPNQDGDLEDMDRLAENFPIAAWKTYTQWGAGGKGFYMTDDFGEAFIEKAKKLGVKNIAIHKGFSFGSDSFEHSLCSDIGLAAKRHPDINFILYHSGYDTRDKEGPFTPGQGKSTGIDVLCQSLIDHDVAPNSNVYSELGSTWRYLMRDPEEAAHALGKLLLYCGEDNMLWGTDSIWYGSPQDQIQSFRAFQISEEYRERYGYQELTRCLKTKIFGLNAMKPYNMIFDEVKKHTEHDALAWQKHAYLERPDPSFMAYGPQTRREFLNLQSWQYSQK